MSVPKSSAFMMLNFQIRENSAHMLFVGFLFFVKLMLKFKHRTLHVFCALPTHCHPRRCEAVCKGVMHLFQHLKIHTQIICQIILYGEMTKKSMFPSTIANIFTTRRTQADFIKHWRVHTL